MTEKINGLDENERLLNHLFEQHRPTEPLADNGFTRQVMNRLPPRLPLWARLWTPCCALLTLALFLYLRGFQQIWQALREIFVTQTSQIQPANLDPKVYLIGLAVIMALGYSKLVSMDR